MEDIIQSINNAEFEFVNKDIQNLVFQMHQNYKGSWTCNFDSLVCLYKLKTMYKSFAPNKVGEVNTLSVVYKGKTLLFTYYDTCLKIFGLSKTTVQHYNQFAERYIDNLKSSAGGTLRFKYEVFNDIAITALLELCVLDSWQVESLVKNNVLVSGLTREKIRYIIRKIKKNPGMEIIPVNFIESEEDEEKPEIEVPEFDIDRETEYSLFDLKSYSKKDLIFISYNCYINYLKMKKKLEKLKKVGK